MSSSSSKPDAAPVARYYASGAEAERLERGVAQLEAVRTRQLLARELPPAPATVVDVGGGTGVHALWLAEQGYVVHLLDPVPELIAVAHARSATASRPLATAQVGDARALPYPDASADALLLLGPLYHLTEPGERAAALAEARRVLRPNGVVFAAAITRWAGALYGLTRGLYAQPGFEALVQHTLESGQNRNPAGLPGGFTTAFFHRPEELASEVALAGFANVTLHGLEGPASLLPDFEACWRDPEQRRTIERLADTLGQEPSLLGVSAHLLAIAYVPAAVGAPEQPGRSVTR